LDLKKLSPSYKVFYPDLKSIDNNTFESMNVYADIDRMAQQFESVEK
jgi:hypothetical protein